MESNARHEIEKLVENLQPEDRELLSAMPESDLIRLHHGYGTWLRNQFRQNKLPHLFKFCSATVPSENRSFDAISAVAIRQIWLHIRPNPEGIGPSA
jgi:hypothetical protein